MKSHDTPLQVAVAFAGGVHGLHEVAPHELVELLSTHWVPHLWKPGLQTKSHAMPVQIAVELGGGVHGVQLEPQLAIWLLSLHSLPQRWKPVLQVKSHALLVHAGTALAMPPQLAHDGPHELTLLSASQSSPHWW